MKTASGVVGISVSFLIILSYLVFDGVNSPAREEIFQASFVGIGVAFTMFFAGALTFRLPQVGGLIFVIAAFLAFSISNDLPDMAYWGSISLVLGTLAGFSGWKEKMTPNEAKSSDRNLIKMERKIL